jgi:hypothetical protein
VAILIKAAILLAAAAENSVGFVCSGLNNQIIHESKDLCRSRQPLHATPRIFQARPSTLVMRICFGTGVLSAPGFGNW